MMGRGLFRMGGRSLLTVLFAAAAGIAMGASDAAAQDEFPVGEGGSCAPGIDNCWFDPECSSKCKGFICSGDMCNETGSLKCWVCVP